MNNDPRSNTKATRRSDMKTIEERIELLLDNHELSPKLFGVRVQLLLEDILKGIQEPEESDFDFQAEANWFNNQGIKKVTARNERHSGGVVYLLYEDGEVTYQKAGDLFGLRTEFQIHPPFRLTGIKKISQLNHGDSPLFTRNEFRNYGVLIFSRERDVIEVRERLRSFIAQTVRVCP